MLQELVGNQWNEGDVSCSVVRRVALADAFYAIDAILDTTIRIIRDLVVQSDVVEREVKEYLPFLVTTRMLSEAVMNGMGREDAHALIKKLSMIASEDFRKTGINNLIELVSQESDLGFTAEFLVTIQDPSLLVAGAVRQTRVVMQRALAIAESIPDSLAYIPADSI
jgi:adenylosuccinate lyase